MVVGGALRATGCASCRLTILRHFTSAARPSIQPLPLSRTLCPSITQPKARYTTHPTQEKRPEIEVEEETIQEGDSKLNKENAAQNHDILSGVSTLPWYLQVQAPERAAQPLSERQRIPDLPESPPPILGPLLQQVSVDLGIDDLTLLDLRKLDPPPALGANLLMIIGTARSEKHLHVSADRLCRWLRSTYKLRPDADGLLGRNELKLKLRRKSRRAKLMGSAVEENGDDGVRTGWVCVDVGVVEALEESTEAALNSKSFIGFGRQTDGVRVVVQMLTEEKREEMDLEKLWGGILRRSIEAKSTKLEKENESEYLEALSNPITSNQSLPEPRSSIGSSPVLTQTRGFHTSARRLLVEAETQSSIEDLIFNTSRVLKPERINLIELQKLLDISDPSKSIAIKRFLQTFIPSKIGDANQGWRPIVLDRLLFDLENMSNKDAKAAMGKSAKDLSSTSFLACFHQSLTNFPSTAEGDARLRFLCFAVELQHKGYTPEDIIQELRKLELYGLELSTDLYKRMLHSVLQPRKAFENGSSNEIQIVKNALYVLEAMHADGHDVLIEDILVELQTSMVYSHRQQLDFNKTFTNESTFDISSIPVKGLQQRLHALLMAVPLPCFTEDSRLRLLELYSQQQLWLEFWDIWRMAPSRGQPQSPRMYAFMFNKVAKTDNLKGCTTVLRTWVPEMAAEEYMISFGKSQLPIQYEENVEKAIQACLKVVEPSVEHEASNTNAKGEWLDMWRRSTGTIRTQEEIIHRRIKWDQ